MHHWLALLGVLIGSVGCATPELARLAQGPSKDVAVVSSSPEVVAEGSPPPVAPKSESLLRCEAVCKAIYAVTGQGSGMPESWGRSCASRCQVYGGEGQLLCYERVREPRHLEGCLVDI